MCNGNLDCDRIIPTANSNSVGDGYDDKAWRRNADDEVKDWLNFRDKVLERERILLESESHKGAGKRRSKSSNKPKKSAKRVKTAKRSKSRKIRRQRK